MIDILKILVPIDYHLSAKVFLYYIKTLQKKIYKISAPDISPYQIEIFIQDKDFTIVNHQHYTTQVTKMSFNALEIELKKHFQPENPKQYEIDFVQSLRF